MLLLSVLLGFRIPTTQNTRHKKKSLTSVFIWKPTSTVIALLVLAAVSAIVFLLSPAAQAATSTPLTFVYNGHLLDASGNPVTSAHSVRFSFWRSADFTAGDAQGNGDINTGASNYLQWQETFTVTPGGNGYFTVQLGSTTPLPDFAAMARADLLSMFLQVDVKQSSAPSTSYELLDINASDASVDRSPVVSVPFALNADMVDQRNVGTGSGSIPVLQAGGYLSQSAVPLGLSGDSFTVDADDSASTGSLVLQFGQTLQKRLSFDIPNSRFNFNDDVRIQGSLTVTGLINGFDLSTFTEAPSSHLRVSSGAGLTVNVARGGYRVDGNITQFTGTSAVTVHDNAENNLYFTATGLTVTAASFPADRSIIPLATVTTSGGVVTSVSDRRVLQSDDRQNTILQILRPGYEGAAFEADGTDNVGQLRLAADTTNKKNYYAWTSTKTSLNDYDIYVTVPVPLDFSGWRNGMTLEYRSTSADAADNRMDIEVYDTSGTPVTLSGSVTALAQTSWTDARVEFAGTPAWTPGETFLIKLKLSAKNSAQMHAGNIMLDYREINRE